MSQTHSQITGVWIAADCIVCDSCQSQCPDVFEIQDQKCVIRPAAMSREFVGALTASILAAADKCPVDAIRFEMMDVAAGEPRAGAVDAGAAAPAQAPTRRGFNIALTVGWGALALCTATSAAIFLDFMAPKVGKEPKKIYRVGTLDDYGTSGAVYEQFKPVGFWLVNLLPKQPRLVALSTVCTHLGCIPDWQEAEKKFKCPCHGSGYLGTGINFEGPAPRPLERFAISRDADGQIVVDMGRTYRYELGQWDDPESFVPLA